MTLGEMGEEDAGAGERAPLTDDERSELEQLRKAHLQMQLDFAKKVATWFANGQQ